MAIVNATWKTGFAGLYNASAQLVAEEILSIGDEVTPRQIVEFAKDSNTELHKCFEWDDKKAAAQYRVYQARQIVCHLVIKRDEEQDGEKDKSEIRLLYRPQGFSGYRPINLTVRNENEYEALLTRARNELRAFKAKYNMLSELEEILALID